jgi:hypothetical protein
MSTRRAPSGEPPAAETYEIRVDGRLDARWVTWFDGLALTAEGDGTTTLRGAVVDQAALHGLLQRIRDLGLVLVSVTSIDPIQSEGTSAS